VSDDTKPTPSDQARMRRLSRRGFLMGGLYVAGLYGAVKWLNSSPLGDGTPWPFRRALDAEGDLLTDIFPRQRLVPTYPLSRVQPARTNGMEGLGEDFDPLMWSLSVEGIYGADTPKVLSLEDVMALPHVEMTTELFCIEGWSVIQHWKGARFVDFAKRFLPPTIDGSKPDVERAPEKLVPYVSMETPDGGYYVSLDMPSALHPQTLLCWEMNGEPLTLDHGAPLRLVIPVKYGIKNIKRIGTIRYETRRPRDYWGEQGYDYYAGL